MWLVLTRVVAIAFTGLAIKIVDDALDRDFDLVRGRPGLTSGLEDSSASYAGLLMVIATFVAPVDALSLFGAAYAWGMLKAPHVMLPWGGRAWQESLLVVLGIGFAVGLRPLVSAIMLMASVQLIDDLIDEHPCCRGEWLWSERSGLALALVVLVVFLDAVKTGAVLGTVGVLWTTEALVLRRWGGG